MTASFSTLWQPAHATAEWCHTGIAVTASGAIAFGAPEARQLVVIDDDAPKGRRIDVELTELHGLTAVGDRLWVADPGMKARPDRDYAERQWPGRAALISLDGRIERELRDPFEAGRTKGPWRPTSIAPIGESGDVWVADGYGESLLHLFDEGGDLVRTVDGSESGTAFQSPHGVVIWPAEEGALLAVADRRNRRLLLLSLDGVVVDVIEDTLLRSPSTFAVDGEALLLTELDGAILRVWRDGHVEELIGRVQRDETHDGWPARPGWPNDQAGGLLVRPPLTDGVLNSPHGIAVDVNGDIVLTEWLIGGRYSRIIRRSVP